MVAKANTETGRMHRVRQAEGKTPSGCNKLTQLSDYVKYTLLLELKL